MMTIFGRFVCGIVFLIIPTATVSADDPPTSKPLTFAPELEPLRKLLRETAARAEALPDPRVRFIVLCIMADSQVRIGDRDEARENSRKASRIIKGAQVANPSEYLIETARIMGAAGDLEAKRREIEEALHVASAQKTSAERVAAWNKIVIQLAELGDRAKAVEITDWMAKEARTVPEGRPRLLALTNTAHAKAYVGDLEGSLKFALEVSSNDDELRVSMFSNLVVGVEQPFRTRPKIYRSHLVYGDDLPNSRLQPRGEKVVPADRDQRHKFLLELARRPDANSILSNSTSEAMVRVFSELGDLENASKLVEKLASTPINPDDRTGSIAYPGALIEIAKAQSRAGRIEAAHTKLVQAIEFVKHHPEINPLMRDFAMSRTATALAESGQVAEAIKTLSLGPVPPIRVFQLAVIARIQEVAGDLKGARETNLLALKLAEEGVKKPGPEFMMTADRYQSQVTVLRAKLGEYTVAESVFAQIKDPSNRNVAAYQIGFTRASHGDLVGATSWAATITDITLRSHVLDGIAEAVNAKAR